MKFYKIVDMAAILMVAAFLGSAGLVFFYPEDVHLASVSAVSHPVKAEPSSFGKADTVFSEPSVDSHTAVFASRAEGYFSSESIGPEDVSIGSSGDAFRADAKSQTVLMQELSGQSGSDEGSVLISAPNPSGNTDTNTGSSLNNTGSSLTADPESNLLSSGTADTNSSGSSGAAFPQIESGILQDEAAGGFIESLDCNSFAVELPGGQIKIYIRPSGSSPDDWKIQDSVLQARVRRDGEVTWLLEVKAGRALSKVWFPWCVNPLVDSYKAGTYFLYYPYLLGTLSRSDFRKEWEWWGVIYPGTAFAPLMILGNAEEGLMAAAANWPPKKTKVNYSYLRMSFVYEEIIAPSETAVFGLLYCRLKGEPARGVQAWHLGVDVYRNWLDEQMRSAGLLPIDYPAWMKQTEGFINVQLQNSLTFNVAELYAVWNRWQLTFPWVQFWGQMSDYGGQKGGGCCLEKMDVHSRYRPELIRFVRNITSIPGRDVHVGYYARPLESDTDLAANLSERTRLLNWLRKNQTEYYANAFYVDVLGARYFGDALGIANLLKTELPQDLFIEYAVDVYPAAFLVSGSLAGNQVKDSDWAKTPKQITYMKRTAPFPSLGRYLLSDRLLLMGESNGDHMFWGSKADYWTERQAFLLGAKFDVTSYTLMNPENTLALEQIVAERKRLSWWQREPVYWDTKGLTDISAGIDVRRYKDKNGKDLFVIDNWPGGAGKRFSCGGKTFNVPPGRLVILEGD